MYQLYLFLLLIVFFLFLRSLYATLKSLNSFQAKICRENSKSFFFASLLYPTKIRSRVFVFYAFARVADDLIDEASSDVAQKRNIIMLDELVTALDAETDDEFYQVFAKHSPNLKLAKESVMLSKRARPSLKNKTEKKIDSMELPNFSRIMVDFRKLVRQQKIPSWTLKLLLRGFEHDANTKEIEDDSELLTYCLGVASSIGLVCSFLFIEDPENVDPKFDPAKNKRVLEHASSLGIGMQLTNIARDILTDADIMRTYIPNTWLKEHKLTSESFLALSEDEKQPYVFIFSLRLIEMAETYYQHGWDGIKLLPPNIQPAICSALLIYREIGMIIKTKLSNKEGYPRRAFTKLPTKLKLVVEANRLRFFGISPKFLVNPKNINCSSELLTEYMK